MKLCSRLTVRKSRWIVERLQFAFLQNYCCISVEQEHTFPLCINWWRRECKMEKLSGCWVCFISPDGDTNVYDASSRSGLPLYWDIFRAVSIPFLSKTSQINCFLKVFFLFLQFDCKKRPCWLTPICTSTLQSFSLKCPIHSNFFVKQLQRLFYCTILLFRENVIMENRKKYKGSKECLF